MKVVCEILKLQKTKVSVESFFQYKCYIMTHFRLLSTTKYLHGTFLIFHPLSTRNFTCIHNYISHSSQNVICIWCCTNSELESWSINWNVTVCMFSCYYWHIKWQASLQHCLLILFLMISCLILFIKLIQSTDNRLDLVILVVLYKYVGLWRELASSLN